METNMFYSIITKITDNDPKGLLGGTQYQLTISKGDEVVESHIYSIMDIIIADFNPSAIIQKYVDMNKSIADAREKELKDSIQKAKGDDLANKMNNISDELHSVILDVIASNAPLVQQYMNGNDKVLNALVGQTMKKYKGDAAVIKQLLINGIKK